MAEPKIPFAHTVLLRVMVTTADHELPHATYAQLAEALRNVADKVAVPRLAQANSFAISTDKLLVQVEIGPEPEGKKEF